MYKTIQPLRSFLPILPVLLCLLFCSCSTQKFEPELREAQLSLRVLETAGGTPVDSSTRLFLTQEQGETGLNVNLHVQSAEELRSLAVEIEFDPHFWQWESAKPGDLLGNSHEVLLSTMHPRPGLLAHGQVQLAGSAAEAFSGSGIIASFSFTSGADASQRAASAIAPAVPVAEWDELSWTLAWPYGNQGDYDQNSEVNIADLTPIGIHFGAAVADPLSAQAIIDGDGNGEINIADITPIGINYGNSIDGYRIWELAVPTDWQGTADTPSMSDVAFADAVGTASQDLLQFSYTYPADPGFRWLRLAATNGEELGSPGGLLFTYPSLQPLLSAADATGLSGTGTAEDPYLAGVPASIPLQLLLQDSSDVTLDPASEFVLSGPAGGMLSGGNLELDASAAGDYVITASHDSVPSEPYALYFHANEPPLAMLQAVPSSGHVPFTIELDATQSSDPDGEIVLVEWDFDNDGTFERETGTTLLTLRRYEAQGDFEAVVRLTDDGGASSVSDPLAITVLPPNLPPVPVLTADPTSGNTPLTVNFDATASSDPDGTIESADWDFDNDGEFEITGGLELQPQHVYTVPGIHEVVLRLRDDDGAVEFSDPFLINVGGNFPPVAQLRAVPNAGPSPLLVLLDATESSDVDGSIVLVEWDFSGDGEYDQSTTELTVQRSYTGEGTFNPVVRLTDNNGGVAVSTPASVNVGVEAGSPPLAILAADPASGPAPLLVTLDASGSTDPDNDIVLAEFDIGNDGSWEYQDTDDFVVSHEFPVDGTYAVTARITDSYGHRSTSAPAMVIASSGLPPTAVFTSSSLSGNSPLDIVLDASGSSDPDGPVASYEWDVDGDGLFEFTSTQSTAQFSLLATGTHQITLRVIDGDGMSDEFSENFFVSPAILGWGDWNTGVVNPLRTRYAAVGGRPSLAWQSSPSDLFFKRSSDAEGHSWPVTGSLIDSDLNAYPGGSIRLVEFAVSGSVPLLLTLKGTAGQADHDMFVSRGINSDGSSFAAPLKIVSGAVFRPDRDNLGFPLLADFSGLPGICYGSQQSGGWHHLRALDSQGSSWPADPKPISGSKSEDMPVGSLLQDPAGGAQLFYHDDGTLHSNRDPDGNGIDWDFRTDIFNAGDIVRLQAINSSDSVVLVYTVDSGVGEFTLYATHASSPGFSSWADPVEILEINAETADCQMLLDTGKPVILITGSVDGQGGIHFLRSHNSRGSFWSPAQRIISQTGGELRGMALVNGRLTAANLRSSGSLRLLSRE